jgi:hypothetical protein
VLAACWPWQEQRGEDFNLLLKRFAMERLLYRLGRSPTQAAFCSRARCCSLSGTTNRIGPPAMPICWVFGQDDSAHLVALFSELAGMEMHDGIVLDPASVRTDAIRERQLPTAAFAST